MVLTNWKSSVCWDLIESLPSNKSPAYPYITSLQSASPTSVIPKIGKGIHGLSIAKWHSFWFRAQNTSHLRRANLCKFWSKNGPRERQRAVEAPPPPKAREVGLLGVWGQSALYSEFHPRLGNGEDLPQKATVKTNKRKKKKSGPPCSLFGQALSHL